MSLSKFRAILSRSTEDAPPPYNPGWSLEKVVERARIDTSYQITSSLRIVSNREMTEHHGEMMLEKLKEYYSGSVRMRDFYMLIFLAAFNSVGQGKVQGFNTCWEVNFDGVVRLGTDKDPPMIPIQPGTISGEVCANGIKARFNFVSTIHRSNAVGLPLSVFIAGRNKVALGTSLYRASLLDINISVIDDEIVVKI
ncbi:putative matrix protein [Wuhan pillworm virus 2]|uniref:putative matrix protein n=1 Tax=Wuhan pillworm virus 2 TaxID=1923745 RepID=UPI00090C2282|nr:putative matrix protein [Wuhan pillworm virus 2]APG78789.1 putative matrix protein [Wuhan pillworm virus 2]APG78805.1 putative matrix protein [Wuhan pillworm virus 2]